jgi:predicted permease
MRNLKLAVRSLLKTPFVTAVAILSLALGIGANAAIYSLFDQMLLRPLPVAEPDRLVNLGAPGPKPGSQSCNQAGDCNAVFSYAMFRDLEAADTRFSGIAAHRLFSANLAVDGETENAQGMLVSGSYFPVLGLRPALGRLLDPEDDRVVGGHFVAVLSHAYWETRLGADPNVLNSTIFVNGHPLTVVGVAPKGFDGTTLGSRARVFVPLTMRGFMSPGFDGFDNRRSYWAYLFARLEPGVSVEQAAMAVNAVYRPIVTEVEAPLQEGMSEEGMERFRTKEITAEAGRRGQSSVHGEAGTPLLFLFAVTGIVLLIACANIANLLLSRAATRAMEMAVRLSLGASRLQVVVQLLTEALLLALLGGVASLVVAFWTLKGIASILPTQVSTSLDFQLDVPVLLFAGALSMGTGLLFGLFPAIHSTRPDLITTLRANTGQPSGARAAARFRTGLVTAQITLSMALLISAGLFLKSLSNVSRVDLGVRTENVVTFGIAPQLNGYEPARSAQLFERVEQELAALPGVTGVSAGMVPILAGSNWGTDVAVQGFERGPDIDNNSRLNQIGPDYFRTLGIPLLAGREFTTADAAGTSRVAIVNETFARKFGLGRDAVGAFMSDGSGEGGYEALEMEIVGLVQDASYSEVKGDVPPLFFTPYRQNEQLGQITFYARTAVDPLTLLPRIPELVRRLDPNLPVETSTLELQARESIFLDRMIGTLAAAFALLATVLAAIGLYGVLSYTVAQRTREIGVRMALGANAGRVRAMVLRQVGFMLLFGGALGIAAAVGIGRAARSLLFELEGHDPVVIAIAAAALGAVALAAAYLPALRASRVDPMHALRYE